MRGAIIVVVDVVVEERVKAGAAGDVVVGERANQPVCFEARSCFRGCGVVRGIALSVCDDIVGRKGGVVVE